MSASVLSHGLDQRGLTGAGRAMEQQTELVRKALDSIATGFVHKVVHKLQQHLLLLEENALKCLLITQSVPLIHPGIGVITGTIVITTAGLGVPDEHVEVAAEVLGGLNLLHIELIRILKELVDDLLSPGVRGAEGEDDRSL